MKSGIIWMINIASILVLIGSGPSIVLAEEKGITEAQCAPRKGAEIIWDLSQHRWICCTPAGSGLENCIPITDMKTLPKTGLKPLPSGGSKTIPIPRENSESGREKQMQP